jgi:hypothetical protein
LNQPLLSRQKENDLLENRKLMMVVPSRSIVLILGGTEYEQEIGEMTFYMARIVMIWNGLQTNEIDKARGDKQWINC